MEKLLLNTSKNIFVFLQALSSEESKSYSSRESLRLSSISNIEIIRNNSEEYRKNREKLEKIRKKSEFF